jgi:hypothetical protein
MNPELGTYVPEHYNQFFRAMKSEWGDVWYNSVKPYQWNIWRRHIKTMFFDQGYLIREMIAAIPESAKKTKWPMGTGYFSRLRDICDVNRLQRQRETPVKLDRGFQPISVILPVDKMV